MQKEIRVDKKENKVALCEAEVGTGKTHAYILAATVYKLFQNSSHPAIISTSTIALQNAIVEEYVPQISSILIQHRIIDEPLSYTIRKGKSHYACDIRLKTYLLSLQHNAREEDADLIRILTQVFIGEKSIDLDGVPISDYVKRKICVDQCHWNCGLISVCQYRTHIRKSQTGHYDFQITNHNLVIADILARKDGRNGLLPACGVMVIDEAHKLLDVARQMYGMEFESVEMERLASNIYQSIKYYGSDKQELYQICNELLEKNQLFFENLKATEWIKNDSTQLALYFSFATTRILKGMSKLLQRLLLLFFTVRKNPLFERLIRRMEQKQAKIMILLDMEQSVFWVESSGGSVKICTLPKDLDFLLYEDLWKKETPFVLTSGTLSVGGDFMRYKSQTGLKYLQPERVAEVSKASPFDFNEHALLYLPQDMPYPKVKNITYMEAFFAEVIMPSMLIKLRQWIGRGIRRESDTCVFSILDSRAANQYRQAVLNALPDMPVTDCMEDVGRFIREKKTEEYFE